MSSLTGERALECQSRYQLDLILRRFERDESNALVDKGALSLRDYDPSTFPVGNGYAGDLTDSSGTTLLASASVAQNGARAQAVLTFGSNPGNGDTVVLAYPDLATATETSVTTITRTYTFETTPAAAYDVRIGSSTAESIGNLVRAINGQISKGDTFTAFPGTLPSLELISYRSSSTELTIETRDCGVWGNACNASGTAATITTQFSGATGSRGLRVTFEAADLPSTLVSSLGAGRMERRCHFDLVGLDSSNRPVKLFDADAQLHITGTALP